jgi:hypothetical protein
VKRVSILHTPGTVQYVQSLIDQLAATRAKAASSETHSLTDYVATVAQRRDWPDL